MLLTSIYQIINVFIEANWFQLSSVLLSVDCLSEPLRLGDGNLVDDGVDLETD